MRKTYKLVFLPHVLLKQSHRLDKWMEWASETQDRFEAMPCKAGVLSHDRMDETRCVP